MQGDDQSSSTVRESASGDSPAQGGGPSDGPEVETAPAAEEETLPAEAGQGLADDDTQAVSGPPRTGVHARRDAHEDPTRIGRFLVIRRIGAGGMGVVYAAYDETLDRKVAVKLLRPDRAEGTGATSGRARLLREAQALARLSHPNVVHVYEVGTFEDQVFVAMEFIEGQTLKKWQSRPDRDWREVVEVYLAAGRGLSAAHAAGIVHRDFKPDNVLVGDDGSVRVLDFGLAREAGKRLEESLVEGETETPPLPVSASGSQKALATPLTQTGAMMGTPAYMAPEQFHGRSTDARTDQFAFCISLYEGVYGERPFSGKNMAELAHGVVTGEVNPPPQYTKVPPWLRKALLHGLQVRPEKRYTDVDELLSLLAAGLRRRSIGRGLGLLAVGVLGVVGVVAAARSDAETAVFEAERAAIASKFVEARTRGEQLQRETGRGSSVAEQWDRLVLAWAREHVEGDPTLGLAVLAHLDPSDDRWGASARMLAMAALERGVAWRSRELGPGGRVVMSPDGESAAFVRDGHVILHELETGAERDLGEGVGVGPIAISPTGDRVAGISKEGAITVWGESVETGPTCRARQLRWTATSGHVLALCRSDEIVRFRPGEPEDRQMATGARDLFVWPDGESVAVLHVDGAVRLRSPDGSDVRELGFGDPLGALVADPGGEHVLALGQNARRFSFASLEGEAAPAFDGVRIAASSLGADAAVAVQGDGTVVLRNRRGEEVRRLKTGSARVIEVDLSADGEIALTVDEAGRARFWRLGDQPPVYLGRHASPVEHLAFVPGTGQVAAGTDSGTVRLWNAREGGGRVLGQHPSAVRHLAAAPDGALLASASREPGVRLWKLPAGDPLRTVAGDAREGPAAIAWSPAGSRLAVGACRVDGSCPVLVHDVEADATQALGEHTRAATHLAFSGSGTRLLALHPNDAATTPTEGEIWDLETDHGHGLEIGRVGLPLTAAFVQEGEGARIAFAANDRTQLRVFRYGPDGGAGGPIFVEPDLLTVVADAKEPILLLQDADGTLTLWDLRDDALAVIGEREAVIEHLVVSPERDYVLLTGGGESARVVELGSGESRNLLESPRVAAWGETLVGAGEDGRLEVWRDVAPTEPEAFLRWIRDLTDAEVDLQTLR